MNKKDKAQILSDRTIEIINRGGRIVLRKPKDNGTSGHWYLHAWTNLAAGWDKAVWGRQNAALEFMDLALAFAIAPLFKAKVAVVWSRPKRKTPLHHLDSEKGIAIGGYTCARQALR